MSLPLDANDIQEHLLKQPAIGARAVAAHEALLRTLNREEATLRKMEAADVERNAGTPPPPNIAYGFLNKAELEKRRATARDKLAKQFALAYVSQFGFYLDANVIVDRSRALAACLQDANEGPDQ